MYIIWKKENDKAFSEDYFNEVGEQIQALPQENAEGTHYVVGSSRVTVDHVLTLKESFDIFGGENKPEWWNDKILEEV